MTDKKEIIIDNINISECEFLWKEKLPKRVCNNGNLDCDCNSNPNCYFKRLARAKDKINYMEEYIKIVENARNDIERELKRKEQKLEKIKDYCLKNKVAGWVDVEGIIEIIEGKENE